MQATIYAILTRIVLALVYSGALLLHAPLGLFGRLCRRQWRRRPSGASALRGAQKYGVLVIGTFYTRNWCRSHLLPLARTGSIRRVFAVVDGPTEPITGVEYVTPSRRLERFLGRAAAKFLAAMRLAWRERPDLIMGYHLFPGALSALLVARATGARSAYQVTGGAVELTGGGFGTENCLLKHLAVPSRLIERLVLQVVRRFDLVVVRGKGAREFLLPHARRVEIVPGSVDGERLTPDSQDRVNDIVSVGRLVALKQPEQMLEVIAEVCRRRPRTRAIVVGDGPLLPALCEKVRRLRLEHSVELAGHVENVADILQRSKVFLLTSKSEGLSIAMAEAMAAGVVPVVADVGDLGELVIDGETGWLIRPGAIQDYADRIVDLLDRPERLYQISQAAARRALRHTAVGSVAERWSQTIAAVCSPERVTEAATAAPKTSRSSRIGARAMLRRLLPSRRKAWELSPRVVRSLVKPIALRIPPERWLGRSFRQHAAFLETAEHWSPEQAAEYQLTRLREICSLAERAPFYRDTFAAIGFRPRELRSFEDFRRLPTIDAETVRQHLDEMTTVPPTSGGIDRVATGGTGGRPLHFYINAGRSAVEYAHLVRSWRRAGYRLDLPLAVFRGQTVPPDRNGLRHEYDPILRRHYYSNFHMSDVYMRSYLEHIAALGPCYLQVYPSSIVALARFIERSGMRPPDNIRGILAGSENLYPGDRELTERVFETRLFSWYGHTEKLVLAAECESSSDYHVWPTYGAFELLDARGATVNTPGQCGEIVGTGFINTVTPFIRYRTSDYATYLGEKCEQCGRQQPIITRVRGHRTQEMLVARDGSGISWAALNVHDDTFRHVREFQFRQEEKGKATLRIVPADGFSNDDVSLIRKNLTRKLAGRIALDIELAAEIPLTAMGKRTYVDQRLNLGAANAEREVAA